MFLHLYAFARDTPCCRRGPRQLTVRALHHYSIRFGIDTSRDARIGNGGGILVNSDMVIGDNCKISPAVTREQLNCGDRAGHRPRGQDHRRIRRGDFAAIGANAVVISDVKACASVGGIPARQLSRSGSEGYVNRTDYPPTPSA